jgi:hypothetical protein
MLRASLLPAGTGEKRNQSTRVTHPSRSTHRPPRADVPERRDGRATCDRVSASASPSCAALLLGCGVKVLVGPGPGRPTGKEAAAIFTSEEQLQLLAQGRRTSITPRTAEYGGDEDPRTLCTQSCGAASRPGAASLPIPLPCRAPYGENARTNYTDVVETGCVSVATTAKTSCQVLSYFDRLICGAPGVFLRNSIAN